MVRRFWNVGVQASRSSYLLRAPRVMKEFGALDAQKGQPFFGNAHVGVTMNDHKTGSRTYH